MAGESIKFNVSADTAQFQNGMRQVDNVAKGTAAGVQKAFSGLGNLLAGGAILAGLKGIMDGFDRVGKLATRFSTSAESVQRIGLAADLAGTSIDVVAQSMQKASVAATQATTKGGEMAETFKRAGIDAAAFNAAELDEKLIMVAEAFAAAKGNADATNGIIEILGTRAAGQLIPLISNVEELKSEMQGAAVASTDMVRKIEAANDRMTRYGNTLKVTAASGLGGFIRLFEMFGAAAAGTTLEAIERAEAMAESIRKANKTTQASLDDVADEWKASAEAPAGYEDAALKAHKAAMKAAAKEREELEKLNRTYKDAQQAKEEFSGHERDLRLLGMEASGDPAQVAQAAYDRDIIDAQERGMTPDQAAEYARLQAAIRAQSAASGGGGGGGTAPAPTPSAFMTAEQLRADFEKSQATSRAQQQLADRDFGSAARTLRGAEDRANARMLDARAREQLQGDFGTRDFSTALQEFNRNLPLADRKTEEEFRRMRQDAAMTPAEKAAAEEQAAKGGGKGAAPSTPVDQTNTKLDTVIKLMTERLPIRVLAA